MELLDQLLDIVGDHLNVVPQRIRDGAEFAVIQLEEDRRFNAELLASTRGFLTPRFGQGVTSRNAGAIVRPFLALGGDGQVNLRSFAGIARQHRSR